jgi:hypothetical protein
MPIAAPSTWTWAKTESPLLATRCLSVQCSREDTWERSVPLQPAMVLFTNGNPYRRHLQNDMPIRESSIKCIDFTNNPESVLALRSNNIKMNSA